MENSRQRQFNNTSSCCSHHHLELVKSSQFQPTWTKKNSRDCEHSGLGITVYNKSQKLESEVIEDSVDNEHQFKARRNLNYVQSLLNNKLIKHQIGICLKKQFDSSSSTYLYQGGGISNLMRCRLPKCPCCSKKIYLEKQRDIEKVLRLSDSYGLDMFMFTLTISHGKKDKLADLMALLSEAKSKLFKHKCVVEHQVSWSHFSLEVNYSYRNGWHPHYHCLVSVKKDSLNQDGIDEIKKQWSKICSKLGVKSSLTNGLDIKVVDDVEKASKYAVKDLIFKKVAVEVASDNKKARQSESISIQEMITTAADGRWKEFGYSIEEAAKTRIEKLIIEYYEVKRKRTFQGCKQFKSFLAVAKERIDILLEETSEKEKKEKKEKIKRIAVSSSAFHKFTRARVWNQVLMFHAKYSDLQDVIGEVHYLIDKHELDIDDTEICYQELTSEEFIAQKKELKYTGLRKASLLYSDYNKCAA